MSILVFVVLNRNTGTHKHTYTHNTLTEHTKSQAQLFCACYSHIISRSHLGKADVVSCCRVNWFTTVLQSPWKTICNQTIKQNATQQLTAVWSLFFLEYPSSAAGSLCIQTQFPLLVRSSNRLKWDGDRASETYSSCVLTSCRGCGGLGKLMELKN